jgi:trk system potassium uptake protein
MLAVAHVLGLTLAIFSVAYVMPIACSLIYGDGQLAEFSAAAIVSAATGLLIAMLTRRRARELKPRDGFLLVTMAWVLLSLSATIPLMLALPDLTFTDAYFEAMSGLTTTGSTVLSGLDDLPPSINFWRLTLHWLGGLGIIVLAVAILPLLGVGGMQLIKAEMPGAVKDEKLTPRITQTAKALWLAYLVITVAGILGLKAGGMGWFDAICHAFSAVALGGFSTHDASIEHFASARLEIVLVVLMVISSLSFARHFLALRRLTLRPYFRDPEAKAVLLFLSVSIIAIAILLFASGTYDTWGAALRHATFNVVSIATTTGFVSQNYEAWPVFAPIWMLFLSCIVCSTGSTGGGIKMFRTLLLSRQAGRELKLLVHPNAIWPVRIGGKTVPERVGDSVLAFIFLYFMTIAMLTFVLLLTGLDFTSSFSAVVSSVNNMGPALGTVGPATTFQGLTGLQTWVCTVAMLLGRLEIFSVLVLLTPAFWRK